MEWFRARLSGSPLDASSGRQQQASQPHAQPGPEQPPHAESEALWWVQSPGEVIWVPRGFWHTTVNLEPTVAFTKNVVPRQSVREVLAALEGVEGQGASVRALRAVVNERHRE